MTVLNDVAAIQVEGTGDWAWLDIDTGVAGAERGSDMAITAVDCGGDCFRNSVALVTIRVSEDKGGA